MTIATLPLRPHRLMRPSIPLAARCAVLAAAVHLAAPAAAQQVPAADASGRITVCVLRDGEIAEVEAVFDTARRDTLVDGRPFSEAHPAGSPPYAAASPWYVDDAPLPFQGRMLMKHGLPRIFAPGQLRRAGEFRGLPLFAEAGDRGVPDVVYVFVRPGCEFHPYQVDYHVGAVRGR